MPTLKPRTTGRHHSEPRVLIQDVIPPATHLALTALAGGGFALAGSGAIREHGIIDRPHRTLTCSHPSPAAKRLQLPQRDSRPR
jgi:hypothetical protein